jgi:hypothetical protein
MWTLRLQITVSCCLRRPISGQGDGGWARERAGRGLLGNIEDVTGRRGVVLSLDRFELSRPLRGSRGFFPQRRRHLPRGNVDKTETMPHGYPDWGQHTGNG